MSLSEKRTLTSGTFCAQTRDMPYAHSAHSTHAFDSKEQAENRLY